MTILCCFSSSFFLSGGCGNHSFDFYQFWQALRYAIQTFNEHKSSWEGLMIRGMTRDYTWVKAATQYEQVIEWAFMDPPYCWKLKGEVCIKDQTQDFLFNVKATYEDFLVHYYHDQLITRSWPFFFPLCLFWVHLLVILPLNTTFFLPFVLGYTYLTRIGLYPLMNMIGAQNQLGSPCGILIFFYIVTALQFNVVPKFLIIQVEKAMDNS